MSSSVSPAGGIASGCPMYRWKAASTGKLVLAMEVIRNVDAIAAITTIQIILVIRQVVGFQST